MCQCVATKFAPKDSVNKRKAEKSLYTVTCQAEKNQRQDISLPLAPSSYEFRVYPYCDMHLDESTDKNKARPLNLIIVLDRTKSMEATINAVKSGIVEFADGLEADGWDVHFAAIGFRDYINDFIITPFTDAKSLKEAMDAWRAEGGQDYQEAGMQAILTAYEVLKDYKREKPERKDSMDAILYASDGVAYAGQNPQDFSITELAARTIKELNGELPKLKFYYSVPEVNPQEEYELAAPKPRQQMEDFVLESKVPGKAFEFPLGREILGEFSKEFVEVTRTDQLICEAQAASFNSASSSGIPSSSNRNDILEQLKKGEPLSFTPSPDPLVKDYTLTIVRCCAPSGNTENSECKPTQNSTLKFNFKKN